MPCGSRLVDFDRRRQVRMIFTRTHLLGITVSPDGGAVWVSSYYTSIMQDFHAQPVDQGRFNPLGIVSGGLVG